MKHFSLSDWVDFVRETALPARQLEMQRHLEGGCAPCGRLAALFAEVRDTARLDLADPVPAELVAHVRALFRQRFRRPEPAPSVLSWLRQSFDSLLAPAPAFARSAEPQSWQGLYENQQWLVDLRADRYLRRPRLSLVGQLADPRNPARSPAGAMVEIRRDGRLEGVTMTLPGGEFELEVASPGELELRISTGEGDPLGVALGDLSARLDAVFKAAADAVSGTKLAPPGRSGNDQKESP